jgi:hypothetical protein
MLTNPAADDRIGRLCVLGNIIELPTAGSPFGIRITSFASPKTHTIIGQFIARQNQIRHVDGAAGGSGTLGITMDCISQAIVEENLINIGTDPANPDIQKGVVRTSMVKKIKTFNNESSAGVFLPCWNSTASAHDGDLVTDVEAGVMAL